MIMRWFPATLAIPANLVAVTCSMVAVHPWTFGAGYATESGNYLNPVAAVDYLTNKLSGAAGEHEIIVMMLTATQHDDFMSQLSAFSNILPLPVIGQVTRRAQAIAELAITKMQIPTSLGGLPDPMPLSVSTSRSALNAQLIEAAKNAAGQAVDLDNIKSALDELKQQGEKLASEVSESLAGLQAGSANAWAFVGAGDINTAIAAMKKEIPEKEAIYTIAVMFVAESLDGLKEMIKCRELPLLP